tara:strand:+ start:1442 stop:2368 length:927 start_codon:yes stop_codon:yes gene_type:complete
MQDEEERNETLDQIESEIKDTQRKAGVDEDFEIEIVEPEKEPEKEASEPEPEEQDSDGEYGERVQRRIKKLVDQRRSAEILARTQQEETSQLRARLERLERGNQQSAQAQAETSFNQRYLETRKAFETAVEEGDTSAQLNFTEQLADMRASARIAEMQKAQQAQQQSFQRKAPARAPQAAQTPKKAMGWWQNNKWFNSDGFERETAAARSIDVQLDLEGYDKESDKYYGELNNRLLKMFPEISSDGEPTRKKSKSRSPVAPTAGGTSSYKGNRIRLSNDQLRMARELGITDESGLKKYEAEIRQQNRN